MIHRGTITWAIARIENATGSFTEQTFLRAGDIFYIFSLSSEKNLEDVRGKRFYPFAQTLHGFFLIISTNPGKCRKRNSNSIKASVA